MPGTIDDPVRIDPFQTIVEVGWNQLWLGVLDIIHHGPPFGAESFVDHAISFLATSEMAGEIEADHGLVSGVETNSEFWYPRMVLGTSDPPNFSPGAEGVEALGKAMKDHHMACLFYQQPVDGGFTFPHRSMFLINFLKVFKDYKVGLFRPDNVYLELFRSYREASGEPEPPYAPPDEVRFRVWRGGELKMVGATVAEFDIVPARDSTRLLGEALFGLVWYEDGLVRWLDQNGVPVDLRG